jgi:hypothetical protein
MLICFLFHISLDEPNYRLTSLVGILGVSGIRLLSVAHHDACQSLFIGYIFR